MRITKPTMLTVPQLGKMDLLPTRAIRALIKDGRLPTLKIGARNYVNLDVFIDLLKSGDVT